MNSAEKARWTVQGIQNEFGKLPDFLGQSENGRYRSSTVFRPIPATPYPVFVPISYLPNNTKMIRKYGKWNWNSREFYRPFSPLVAVALNWKLRPWHGRTGTLITGLEAWTKIRMVWSKLNQAPGRHLCSRIQDREYRAGMGALTQEPKAGKHQIEERRVAPASRIDEREDCVGALARTKQKLSGAAISEPRPENRGGCGKARPTSAHKNKTRTA
jgi:hypothetical protein